MQLPAWQTWLPRQTGPLPRMSKKVRKVTRTPKPPADKAGRWTVRGVPPVLQKSAGDAARARGLTIGQFLTELVEAAIGAGAAPAQAPVGWAEAIEQRLDRLEQAVFARLADRPAEPATAG